MATRACFVVGALLMCLVVSAIGIAQSGNAILGGTVSDSTSALIPGVTVTATNTQTGIKSTTVTNEAGTYQFPSVQPGAYKVTAELPGFRTQTYNDVTLGVAQQVRLNFTLEVGGVTQSVEVAVQADTLIATTSASVGAVLPEYKVRDLPLSNRNVLDLVATTANVSGSSFAGAPTGMAITTRDGISVNDGRYNNGVFSATVASPDLVEEVRVIVTPADAALGRGAGQVQMQTRSGTNQFRGSVFVTNRNSIWDASTFANNFNGIKKNYINRNDFGVRIGGPIVKNKTFFFFLYEGLQYVQKTPVTTTVLTDSARRGIYRYFPGTQSGNALAASPTVDLAGNPIDPTGQNRAVSSFNVFTRDPLRTGADPTGWVQKNLALIPLPNDFTVGDGLNTAGYRWIRRSIGSEANSGQGTNLNWNQFNLRIDHNFNTRHKLSLVGSDQRTRADLGQAAVPTGQTLGIAQLDGESNRHPVVYTAQLVSTLSSTLVNEARVGLRRGRAENVNSYDMPGAIGEEARKLLLYKNGIPYIPHSTFFTTQLISDGNSSIGSRSPMWIAADDVSWTKGKHSFKSGLEVRFGTQWSWNSDEIIPHANFGPTSRTAQYFQSSGNILGIPVNGIDNTSISGLSSNDQQRARDLLVDLAGSVAQISEAFSLCPGQGIKFLDYSQCYKKSREFHQNELSTYFKDDWKIRPNLTLNAGLRWEWFGVVHEKSGLMAMPVGGSNGLFGISGTGWEDWYKPGRLNGSLTVPILIDKGSPNPGLQLFPDDWNNFAPAVGLSWTLPWLGKDKTVLRLGYGVSYQGYGTTGGGLTFDIGPGLFPGMNQFASDPTGSTYRNLTNIVLPVPNRYPDGQLQITPLESRNEAVSTWDNHLVNPYIQNWSLGLQREIVPNLTLEIGYVGSKGTKLYSGINLNTPVTIENGLMDAFKTTIDGGNAPLFDRMLAGLNLGSGVVNGTSVTGSMSLRASSSTRGFLATGDVGGLANYLNTTTNFTNVAGGLLRNGKLPENFIVVNPQFTTVTLNGNPNNSTYHALNLSVNKRLSQGLTNQTTYTWSRNLGTATSSDPRDRQFNGKTLVTMHRTHRIQSNGTYELPFGPGRPFLSNAPGFLKRIVERWQFGAIFSLSSGQPFSLTSNGSPYLSGGTNYPDLLVSLPKSTGQVTKTSTPGVVTYFDGWKQVADPGKLKLTTLQGLQSNNSNMAIQDAQGNLILVNPAVGTIGNMGPLWFQGPGSIGLDADIIKRVRIAESKEFELRVDAINVLNHPNWGNPTTNINSNNFGRISLPTTGNRQFTFNVRLNF